MDTVKSSPVGAPSREDRGKSKMTSDSEETYISAGHNDVTFAASLDNKGAGKALEPQGNKIIFRL